MRYVVIDFESASPVDLKKSGAWVYAENPATEILSLAYAMDDDEPSVLTPGQISVKAEPLYSFVEDPDVLFIAHNAGFEKAIWRNIMVPVYGWPDIPNGRWHDTAASAAQHGLPLKLEVLGRLLKLKHQKWMQGNKVTMALSKPNKKGYYERSPEKLAQVYEYNKEDIYAQRELHQLVGWQTPSERRVWLMDQRINERGVRLDVEFISAADRVVLGATLPRQREFGSLTDGLKVTQRDKVLKWALSQGAKLPNLRKETIIALLGEEDDDGETETSLAGEIAANEVAHIELPGNVRRALEIRQILGSASIKKLKSMRASLAADGRVHGALQYFGAISTGRWSGRLFQPQNFPRGEIKAPPSDLVNAIKTGDWEYVESLFGEPITAIGSGLRHAIIPSVSGSLVVGDYSTIEARIVLAIAGQYDVLALMEAGKDVYIDMAQRIYRRPLNKKDNPVERQTGKNSVLGCGFQMGWRKFKLRYAKNMTDEEAQHVIKTYREEFAPNVPKLWKALEDAALATVRSGVSHEAYGIRYVLEGSYLVCYLHSGRPLYYPFPHLIRKAMPWDAFDIREAWAYKSFKKGQIMTVDAYGGLLTENVVQATARDLLVDSIFKAEENGMPLVLTVHDENICDVPEARADAEALRQIMRDIPPWAKQLRIPVEAETWVGDQYRK